MKNSEILQKPMLYYQISRKDKCMIREQIQMINQEELTLIWLVEQILQKYSICSLVKMEVVQVSLEQGEDFLDSSNKGEMVERRHSLWVEMVVDSHSRHSNNKDKDFLICSLNKEDDLKYNFFVKYYNLNETILKINSYITTETYCE